MIQMDDYDGWWVRNFTPRKHNPHGITLEDLIGSRTRQHIIPAGNSSGDGAAFGFMHTGNGRGSGVESYEDVCGWGLSVKPFREG